jgi:uncharacterized membrane protein YoaK (UPF0700 family)
VKDPATKTARFELALRDVTLIALTFSSGAVDAISYFGLGKVFSAFMTGNLVFLGFGIAGAGGPSLPPVVVALSAFCAGVYLATRMTLRSGQSDMWPTRVSGALCLTAIAEAGFLALWAASAGQPSIGTANILLALFALAMGIQTGAVRSLGVQGVFTTAATFTLVAFAGDFAGSRPASEMPRLAGVLVGLVAGAIAGGLLFVHARSCAPLLPLLVTVLVILTEVIARRAAASATPPCPRNSALPGAAGSSPI